MRDNDPVRPADETRAPAVTDADDTPAPPAATAARPRRIGLFLLVALLALALDVVSKILVVAELSGRVPTRLLGGVVYLDVTRNSGAAFSLGTGFTVILTAVAVAVVLIILRTASRMRSVGWAVALGLVLGGALGNLADRLFRAPGVGRGHVVDFISVFGPNGSHWPIFNAADSAIVCGAVLAAVLALRGTELDGRGARSDRG